MSEGLYENIAACNRLWLVENMKLSWYVIDQNGVNISWHVMIHDPISVKIYQCCIKWMTYWTILLQGRVSGGTQMNCQQTHAQFSHGTYEPSCCKDTFLVGHRWIANTPMHSSQVELTEPSCCKDASLVRHRWIAGSPMHSSHVEHNAVSWLKIQNKFYVFRFPEHWKLRFWSSGMWHLVFLWVNNNVSEDPLVSFFMVDIKNGGSVFHQNVSIHLQHYMLSQSKRPQSEYSLYLLPLHGALQTA
jgi:hypothetical protein